LRLQPVSDKTPSPNRLRAYPFITGDGVHPKSLSC